MTTPTIRVEGLEETLGEISKLIRLVPLRTHRGMIAAGLLIKGAAQKKTPVDLGNLRASAFVVWRRQKGSGFRPKGVDSTKFTTEAEGTKVRKDTDDLKGVVKESLNSSILKPEVGVGFGAAYAIFVHEDLEANHTVGEAKFLEKAIKDNVVQILRIVAEEVREAA